jgi:hypothetical protein
MAIEMHMPVHELLERFTSYELREIVAYQSLQKRTELEQQDSKEGTLARAKKKHREEAVQQELTNGDHCS